MVANTHQTADQLTPQNNTDVSACITKPPARRCARYSRNLRQARGRARFMHPRKTNSPARIVLLHIKIADRPARAARNCSRVNPDFHAHNCQAAEEQSM